MFTPRKVKRAAEFVKKHGRDIYVAGEAINRAHKYIKSDHMAPVKHHKHVSKTQSSTGDLNKVMYKHTQKSTKKFKKEKKFKKKIEIALESDLPLVKVLKAEGISAVTAA